jgi:hypothetical protein
MYALSQIQANHNNNITKKNKNVNTSSICMMEHWSTKLLLVAREGENIFGILKKIKGGCNKFNILRDITASLDPPKFSKTA